VSPDYGVRDNEFTGEINWVQIDIRQTDFDHLFSREERLNLALMRQQAWSANPGVGDKPDDELGDACGRWCFVSRPCYAAGPAPGNYGAHTPGARQQWAFLIS
jgi:hypothetical protein